VCGRNLIKGLTSSASPRVDISSTCKVGQKLGVSLLLLTCSPSAWPSRLLYRRGQKSRRDLWITLYPTFVKYLSKKWEKNEAVHQLFIDFKKAYDSVTREVLYSTLIEFGIPTKLVRLIKICLTETYSRVRVGKNLSDMYLLGIVWNKTMIYRHCFSTLL